MLFRSGSEEDTEDECEEAEEEVRALEAMVVEARKRAEAVRKRQFDGIELPTVGRGAKAGTSQEAKGKQKKSDGPQYRHQCPAEDPMLKQKVVDKVLDATMSISVREAMAISYEVRQTVKNLATSKRVPAGATASNLVETHHSFATEKIGRAHV